MKLKLWQKLSFLVLANLGLSSLAQIPSMAEDNTLPSYGINLSGVTYYSSDFPFINAFKSADKWRTVCISTDPDCSGNQLTKEEQLLQLDRNGWIKSLPTPADTPVYTRARTHLFFGVKNRYPGGQYILSYQGEGKLIYGGDAKLIESKPGQDVIYIDSSRGVGVWIDLVATDPRKVGNYLRNIVLVKAEDRAKLSTGIFNQKFIDKLEGFKVIRFMDWMDTNKSKEQYWYKRPLVQSATYTAGSMPIEVMVSLSNRVNASPWFNIPHMANDKYVTNFASLVKQNLNPQQKVYVEYSNEVWNNDFPQGYWVQDQAVKEWPAPQYSQIPLMKRFNWHGKRTAQICEIWKNVFADRPQSVVCIMGNQASNSWGIAQSLDCPLWIDKPCYKHKIDALAVATYFGGYIASEANESVIQNWSLNQLFKELTLGGELEGGQSVSALEKSRVAVATTLESAQQRNLKLFAYEGGQHLTSKGKNNQIVNNLLMAANRDSRMYDVYSNYLRNWRNSGGSLFMHFNYVSPYSQWGSWGLLEHIDDSTSPKYQAVKDFMQSNP